MPEAGVMIFDFLPGSKHKSKITTEVAGQARVISELR